MNRPSCRIQGLLAFCALSLVAAVRCGGGGTEREIGTTPPPGADVTSTPDATSDDTSPVTPDVTPGLDGTLEPVARASVEVLRSQGARLLLDDGTVLVIPPHALCQDALVELRPVGIEAAPDAAEATTDGDGPDEVRAPLVETPMVRLRFTPRGDAACEHPIAEALFLYLPVGEDQTLDTLNVVEAVEAETAGDTDGEGKLQLAAMVPEFSDQFRLVHASPMDLMGETEPPTALSVNDVRHYLAVALTAVSTYVREEVRETLTGLQAGQEAIVGALGIDPASGTPVALEFSWRDPNRAPLQDLELDDPALDLDRRLHCSGRNVVVLVHGVLSSEKPWTEFGPRLEADTGATVLYVRHFSGDHISTNGQRFAAALKDLVARYGDRIDTLSIIAHSMGGLISLSALHYLETEDAQDVLEKVHKVVFLASPLDGSNQARWFIHGTGGVLDPGGDWFRIDDRSVLEVGILLLRGTSFGVKAASRGMRDLRFGYLQDADWEHDLMYRYLEIEQEGFRYLQLAPNKNPLNVPPGADFLSLVGIARCFKADCSPDHKPSKDESDIWVQSASAADVLDGRDDIGVTTRPNRFFELAGEVEEVQHTSIQSFDPAYQLAKQHVMSGFGVRDWELIGEFSNVNSQGFARAGVALGDDPTYPGCGAPYLAYQPNQLEDGAQVSPIVVRRFDWASRSWATVLTGAIRAPHPDCPESTWCWFRDDPEAPCDHCEQGMASARCGENVSCATCETQCCADTCPYCGDFMAQLGGATERDCQRSDNADCVDMVDCGWAIGSESMRITGLAVTPDDVYVSARADRQSGWYGASSTGIIGTGGVVYYDHERDGGAGDGEILALGAHEGEAYACLAERHVEGSFRKTDRLDVFRVGGASLGAVEPNAYVSTCALGSGPALYHAWISSTDTGGRGAATIHLRRWDGEGWTDLGSVLTLDAIYGAGNVQVAGTSRTEIVYGTWDKEHNTRVVEDVWVTWNGAFELRVAHWNGDRLELLPPVSMVGRVLDPAVTILGGEAHVAAVPWRDDGQYPELIRWRNDVGTWTSQPTPFAPEPREPHMIYVATEIAMASRPGHMVLALALGVTQSLKIAVSGVAPNTGGAL